MCHKLYQAYGQELLMQYHALPSKTIVRFAVMLRCTVSVTDTFESVSSATDWMLCVFVYIRQVQDGPTCPKEPEVLR